MSKLRFFLFVLALVGAGFAIHKNWPEIRVFLRFDASGEDESIKLTRKAYTMTRGQTNNDIALSRSSGVDVKRVGWRADKKGEDLFVVRFEYIEEGATRNIYFLVDLEKSQVSSIDDEFAREKHGLPAPR